MTEQETLMPIGMARMLIRAELERIRDEAGPTVCLDVERAIQALIDDAIRRDREDRHD